MRARRGGGSLRPGREGDVQDFGEAARAELFHDVGAVHFDGSRADPEIERDRFVLLARGQPLEHVQLARRQGRSEEHTSELQSLMRISYAVFCLRRKKSTARDRLAEYEFNDIT